LAQGTNIASGGCPQPSRCDIRGDCRGFHDPARNPHGGIRRKEEYESRFSLCGRSDGISRFSKTAGFDKKEFHPLFSLAELIEQC
jgi:hypothetical protein